MKDDIIREVYDTLVDRKNNPTDSYTSQLMQDSEKKAEDRKEEEGKLVKSTYNYRRAESRFRLPDVGKEDISAKYEDGELKITIKKKEKKLPEENTIDIE